MKKFERLKKKYNNFMYDHYHLKRALHETNGVICGLVAAFLYAFGFICFVSPVFDNESFNIVTGGVSGLTQNLALILKVSGIIDLKPSEIQSIGYTCFNIPLLIFAFFKIGKRFSIQTAINILSSSFFLFLIPKLGIVESIVESPVMSYVIAGEHYSFVIVRALFAAICTGLASAIAFKGDLSCGGIDIITYYFSMRKSTSVGKYSIFLNSLIIFAYSLILVIADFKGNFGLAVISLLVSAVYLFITSFIIDMIHLRNKKIQIEFITKSSSLGGVLIANFPHGATMLKAEGVYTSEPRFVIRMVVSSFETQKVITLARKADPHVFITVTSLVQVYGNFFIKPIG
ncbi:MAG TPA: YitT family protein [Bacilli bacterium]|nr:YitT family protein [Bacilli bacterium]